MTICRDCADNKGLIPRNKAMGCWVAECPYCRQEKVVADEIHDYRMPLADNGYTFLKED
jgi:hypothetical protein